MMSGLSSLFFWYDERRRPRRDAPAADQYLKNTINLSVPPCLKRGHEGGLRMVYNFHGSGENIQVHPCFYKKPK